MTEGFAADLEDEDAGFWFTPLHAKSTGLPLTVWIRESRGMVCERYIRIGMNGGPIRDLAQTSVVRVSDKPRLLDGRLSDDHRAILERWVKLNEKTLLDHWEGANDSYDLFHALRGLKGELLIQRLPTTGRP